MEEWSCWRFILVFLIQCTQSELLQGVSKEFIRKYSTKLQTDNVSNYTVNILAHLAAVGGVQK